MNHEASTTKAFILAAVAFFTPDGARIQKDLAHCPCIGLALVIVPMSACWFLPCRRAALGGRGAWGGLQVLLAHSSAACLHCIVWPESLLMVVLVFKKALWVFSVLKEVGFT